MFQIEKGIAISQSATSTLIRATYPFRQMEAGDSVWIDGADAVQKKAINNARGVGKKIGASFVFEQQQTGVRIWRKA
jgi:hypothetical protein